jgi:hypothetical protein
MICRSYLAHTFACDGKQLKHFDNHKNNPFFSVYQAQAEMARNDRLHCLLMQLIQIGNKPICLAGTQLSFTSVPQSKNGERVH